MAASMLGPSAHASRGGLQSGGVGGGGTTSRSSSAGANDGEGWIAGVESKGVLPRVPSGEEIEQGGVERSRETRRERETEDTAVSDLRALLEKALLEVEISGPQRTFWISLWYPCRLSLRPQKRLKLTRRSLFSAFSQLPSLLLPSRLPRLEAMFHDPRRTK